MGDHLPIWAEVDVLVLGGGPAGFAAAVAAARIGAETLLVEQYGFLGGMATSALVMPWNVWAKPLTCKDIGGVYEQLIKALEGHKATYCFNEKTVLRTFDPSMLKIAMDEMAMESGVKLLFHTLAADVIKENERLSGVILQSKAGRGIVKARSFVDATGDGDVAVRAGAHFHIGEENRMIQPGNLIFLMGGVDVSKLIDYLRQNPNEIGNWPPTEEMRFGDGEHICVSGLFQIVNKAKMEGIPLLVDRLFITSTPVKELVAVNATKVYNIDTEDPMALSKAEVEARKQVLITQEFLKKYVPGFQNAYVADIAVQIGIRETRRITGDSIIEMDDVKSGRHYPDRVARLFNVGHIDYTGTESNGNRIVRIEYLPKDLQIPVGSIIAKGIENLSMGGRCISTDHQVFGYIRTQTACFATGQAAGTVAALAAMRNSSLRDINVGLIQEKLTEEGIEL